ncbi:YdeI/OmpD-associated family protein [Intrasporangium sp. DVR]|uniref:YdeI/OmpD-associated family protein n=1 Tax=Intrasporangium sp. DVR TaxID=3127867 RepID=UPI00313A71C8
MRHGGTDGRPAVFFDDAADFRAWLEANHDSATELWMGLTKKHVEPRGLTWAEAVPEALCFGWIDSVAQGIDEHTRRQRWTPRRPGSVWSRVNIAIVERLKAEGRMQPAGLAAYEQRKLDNTGLYSYEQDEQTWPPEFEAVLRADDRAWAFWEGAAASYRKMCVHWVLSAKRPETRDRRMAQLVDASHRMDLVSPHAYGTEPKWLARLRAELG